MPAFDSCLKKLATGAWICAQRYPEEYEALLAPGNRDRAEAWLGAIGYRLARLHDDGAFFMAHSIVTSELREQVREDLRKVRNRLHPIVGLIQTVRLSQGQNARIHPGDMVYESEIGDAVRQSPSLERRLGEMRDLTGARVTDSALDRVKRMLAILVSEGYIFECNPTLHAFQFTGKVDYLYQLIAFIGANTPMLADDGVVDQLAAEDQRPLAPAGEQEQAHEQGGEVGSPLSGESTDPFQAQS